MAAEVGELRVGLETDFALERLDTAVYVGVLLEARGCGEGLSAVCAGVTSRAHVTRANVTLEIRGIGKDLCIEEKDQFLKTILADLRRRGFD